MAEQQESDTEAANRGTLNGEERTTGNQQDINPNATQKEKKKKKKKKKKTNRSEHGCVSGDGDVSETPVVKGTFEDPENGRPNCKTGKQTDISKTGTPHNEDPFAEDPLKKVRMNGANGLIDKNNSAPVGHVKSSDTPQTSTDISTPSPAQTSNDTSNPSLAQTSNDTSNPSPAQTTAQRDKVSCAQPPEENYGKTRENSKGAKNKRTKSKGKSGSKVETMASDSMETRAGDSMETRAGDSMETRAGDSMGKGLQAKTTASDSAGKGGENVNDTATGQYKQINGDQNERSGTCKQSRCRGKKKPNKQKKNEDKLQGLANSGNTCYMNAALQLVCSADDFREFKLERELEDGDDNRFVHQFTELMQQMRKKGRCSIDSSGIKLEISRIVHRFAGDSQQDSQEFLTALLERLHKSLKTECSLPPTQPADKTDVKAQAEESWHHYLQQGCSIVTELFQGQLFSKLECNSCKDAIVKFDPFMFLSIPVSPCGSDSVRLEDCLQLYTKEEIINGWPCPACHEIVDVKRKVQLSRLPPFLILYLKRYKIDMMGKQHKVSTLVQFPLSGLDVSSNYSFAQKEEKALYNLCAVINHYEYGRSNKGHYTTFSRIDGQWFCFNDDRVHPRVELDIVVSSKMITVG